MANLFLNNCFSLFFITIFFVFLVVCVFLFFARPYNSRKLDFRSTPDVFLGYSSQHLSYCCLNLSSNRVYIARHVKFYEHIFPLWLLNKYNNQFHNYPSHTLFAFPIIYRCIPYCFNIVAFISCSWPSFGML